MFRKENIPVNFNGYVNLDKENYFFNVYNDELRIFYNQTGVSTAKDFRNKYKTILEKGFIYGECPDKRRVVFMIDWENYSAYPDRYSEFRIKGCIKEAYYFFEENNTDLLCEKKFENFKTSKEVARRGKATVNSRRLSEDFKAERRDPPKTLTARYPQVPSGYSFISYFFSRCKLLRYLSARPDNPHGMRAEYP